MTDTPADWSIPTPLYKLVASRLGQSPIEFILNERAQTPPVPYAKIAEKIRQRCNENQSPSAQVDLTHEAPRRWHVRYLREQMAVAAAKEAVSVARDAS